MESFCVARSFADSLVELTFDRLAFEATLRRVPAFTIQSTINTASYCTFFDDKSRDNRADDKQQCYEDDCEEPIACPVDTIDYKQQEPTRRKTIKQQETIVSLKSLIGKNLKKRISGFRLNTLQTTYRASPTVTITEPVEPMPDVVPITVPDRNKIYNDNKTEEDFDELR